MNKVLITLSAIVVLLIGTIIVLARKINDVCNDRDVQRNNVNSLMQSVDEYKTKDSLQAATVSSLTLTLDQYKNYRTEDARIIETLKVDNNRLNGVVTSQTESYYHNTMLLRDSIRILQNKGDSIEIEKVKTASFSDDWHSIDFIINKDSVKYDLKTKESIIIVNHIIPKRFLFFKFGCKEVRNEVVSKNPYTISVNIESVTISN